MPTPSRATQLAAALLVVLGGVALVTQNGVNTSLRIRALKNPFLTAATSFTVGFFSISTAALLQKPSLKGVQLRGAPWWAYLGGLIGMFYVTSAILLVQTLGYAAFQLCVITGMLSASLAADAVGLLGLPKRRPTAKRVLALCVLAAGALLTSDLWETGVEAVTVDGVLLTAAACVSGCVYPVQGAVNGRMAKHLQSPLRATSVSFFGGMLALWCITGISVLASTDDLELESGEAWMYLGGALGTVVVSTNVVGVTTLGAAATASAGLSSQLWAALIFDYVGALGLEAVDISPRRAVGVVVAMAAAVAYQVSAPPVQAASSPEAEPKNSTDAAELSDTKA